MQGVRPVCSRVYCSTAARDEREIKPGAILPSVSLEIKYIKPALPDVCVWFFSCWQMTHAVQFSASPHRVSVCAQICPVTATDELVSIAASPCVTLAHSVSIYLVHQRESVLIPQSVARK